MLDSIIQPANMKNVRLFDPSVIFAEAFLDMAQEFARTNESFLRDARSLTLSSAPDYVAHLLAMASGQELQAGWAPFNTYWLIRDNWQILGISRLRHRLTPTLRQHGGHIGFSIRPSQRRHGYGSHLLSLTLERAKTLGLPHVLITCDTDNIGSQKIIEKNGGELEDELISPVTGKMIRRYWIGLNSQVNA